jgi:hypothetical protein
MTPNWPVFYDILKIYFTSYYLFKNYPFSILPQISKNPAGMGKKAF